MRAVGLKQLKRTRATDCCLFQQVGHMVQKRHSLHGSNQCTELRNNIYRCAVGEWKAEWGPYKHDELVPLFEENTDDAPEMAPLNLYPPLPNEAARAQFRCMKEDWNALGQVCHLLRSEYPSLRNTLTHAYVSVQYLRRYLETFLDRSDGSSTIRPVNHPAKITVFFDKKQTRTFDVLPLMRLMHRAPTLSCDVWTLDSGRQGRSPQPPSCEGRSIHDAVFAAQDSLRAHPDPGFLWSLNRISFSPRGALNIGVNKDYVKSWMKDNDEQKWIGADWNRKRGKGIDKDGTWVKERQRHTREYLEASRMDVDLLEKWKVTVGEGAG